VTPAEAGPSCFRQDDFSAVVVDATANRDDLEAVRAAVVEDGQGLPIVAVIARGSAVPSALLGHVVATAESPDLIEALAKIARQIRKLRRS
jgi:hypothetical protein